ncbi:MAG: hypothetical protein ACTILK_00230 [Bifidobacterium crudilactis]|uniref:hypothetical protein n=1 Tax=Bifidobacterium crudilactis TaxID=327277 RepID=UPI003F972876
MGTRMVEARGVARGRRSVFRRRVARWVASGAVVCGSVLAVPSAFAVTPGEMAPKYTEFPFMDTVANKIQGFMGLTLIVMVGLIAAAAVAWVVAKVINSQGGQKITATIFIVLLVGSAIIGSAGTMVVWGAGLSLF